MGEDPYIGTEPRYLVLKRQGYKVLVLEKDLVFYIIDEENKIVKIYINHAVLQYTNIDYDNMKFEDTEKGLLSFGDISLTMEQQNTLEKSVIDSMNDTLTKSSIMNQADEFAKMKTWEIFQPLVSAVSQEYIVEIEFN